MRAATDALVLFDATDEYAVRSSLAEDPWSGTILETGPIVPWRSGPTGRRKG